MSEKITIEAPILPIVGECPNCCTKTEFDKRGHEYCPECNRHIYTVKEMINAEMLRHKNRNDSMRKLRLEQAK